MELSTCISHTEVFVITIAILTAWTTEMYWQDFYHNVLLHYHGTACMHSMQLDYGLEAEAAWEQTKSAR